ncbi:DUF4174 domain-containing protein [Gramella sp. AN32]|uniref:DUF4174 domain-containing protein n=1 Tax=Christiangramia antarctica TaxID=2058158 RepID=A0ABW5X183_9FLAO|nr:DUF4174 domain-containing protein [Gramella sp. AN32]MCM4155179.1 hypothetical protein [Gramella sp. AN32]
MKLGILLLTLFSFQMMDAQNISKERWENRLLIIIAENAANSNVKDQRSILAKDIKGLKDRNLKIILATPGFQQEILPEKGEIQSSTIYSELNERQDFQVLLIGLDGEVKLKKNQILNLKELFGTIDSMSMRQAEMKSQ